MGTRQDGIEARIEARQNEMSEGIRSIHEITKERRDTLKKEKEEERKVSSHILGFSCIVLGALGLWGVYKFGKYRGKGCEEENRREEEKRLEDRAHREEKRRRHEDERIDREDARRHRQEERVLREINHRRDEDARRHHQEARVLREINHLCGEEKEVTFESPDEANSTEKTCDGLTVEEPEKRVIQIPVVVLG